MSAIHVFRIEYVNPVCSKCAAWNVSGFVHFPVVNVNVLRLYTDNQAQHSVILLVDLHLLPLHSRVLALFVHTCVYTLTDGIFNEQLSYRALYTLKCFAFSLYRTILDFVDDRSWEFNVFSVLFPFFLLTYQVYLIFIFSNFLTVLYLYNIIGKRSSKCFLFYDKTFSGIIREITKYLCNISVGLCSFNTFIELWIPFMKAIHQEIILQYTVHSLLHIIKTYFIRT